MNLRVLVPTQGQGQIVAILDAWTTAIETTARLLEAKRRFRQGAVNRLLFQDDPTWEQCLIGDIAAHVCLRNANRREMPVLSCTIHHGLVLASTYHERRIHSLDLSNYKIVGRDQFVYATNHIEEGSIGLLTEFDEGQVSPMYTTFRVNERVLPRFLFLMLKTERYRQLFAARTSASVNRRGSLRWPQFSRIPVNLPSLAKQQGTIDRTATCDREIELLDAQRQQLILQKRGLMQRLLTGRLLVEETSPPNPLSET